MAIQYIPPTVTKANRIKIDDVNNNFKSNNVEGALNELYESSKNQVKVEYNDTNGELTINSSVKVVYDESNGNLQIG
ncbi:hypothetical protein [Terrisporobacter sp.]|uniref:hypothetical protein n=1 Tax=Terrisporobacter sp. TaxID=1965305 RepID=UPI00261D31EF|nr:hypothetical protein [Terrisporobacter sp.]